MEPLLAVAIVVAVVLIVALRTHGRRALRAAGGGSAAGARQGSATGTYVGAAFFAGFGLFVILVDPMGLSRHGFPNWLLGAALVLIGIALIVVRRMGLR